MFSIQRFLLVLLLSAITLISIFGASWTYYRATQKLAHILDAELVQSANILQHIVNNTSLELHEKTDNLSSQSISTLSEITTFISVEPSILDAQRIFQVWTKDDRLLLKSEDAPSSRLTGSLSGFSEVTIIDKRWRVYTLYDKEKKLYYHVAHPHDLNNVLARHIASIHIVPYLIIFPFFTLIIILSVYYALRPLKDIAQEIFQRKLSHLAPIDISQTPTEIHPLLNEMNSLFKRLEETYAREKRFIADASHELKTPLAALKTHAQLAEDAQTPETIYSAMKNISLGVDRCTRIIQQLLTLSSLQPEQALTQVHTYDLTKLAIEVISELIPFAREKNITVSLEHDNKTPITAPVNAMAFQILLRNLVDNAIRYSDKNTRVTVNLTAHAKKVVLSVIDNGPGVPKELHKQIFERFYRQLGTNTTGSGLGLSIVKQIAQLHSAEIEVKTPETHSGLQIDVVFAVS